MNANKIDYDSLFEEKQKKYKIKVFILSFFGDYEVDGLLKECDFEVLWMYFIGFVNFNIVRL